MPASAAERVCTQDLIEQRDSLSWGFLRSCRDPLRPEVAAWWWRVLPPVLLHFDHGHHGLTAAPIARARSHRGQAARACAFRA